MCCRLAWESVLLILTVVVGSLLPSQFSALTRATHHDADGWAMADARSESGVPPRVVAIGSTLGEVENFPSRKRSTSLHHYTSTRRRPDEPKRSSDLKKKDEKSASKCEPYAQWYHKTYPTCNSMHEVDFRSSLVGRGKGQAVTKLLGIGANSLGWSVHRSSSRRPVVFRNQRFDREFVLVAFENQRMDSIILERLSSSHQIIDLYGYCGVSTMNEHADGGTASQFLNEIQNRGGLTSRQVFSFAKDAMMGLADIHSTDGEAMATVVHRDVQLSNMVVLSDDGDTWKLKLHDFNTARFLQWNFGDNRTCGWGRSFECDGKWKRTPEDCAPRAALPFDYPREKKDVYALGAMLFKLLTGQHPYSFEPDRRLPKVPTERGCPKNVDGDQFVGWLRAGRVSSFPKEIEESEDPAVVATRRAVRLAMDPDMYRRPSARRIADGLVEAEEKIGFANEKM